VKQRLFFILGLACLISGCESVKWQGKDPSEVIRIWNDALYDSDIELAQKHTSKTSNDYISKSFGSLMGLVNRYQSTKFNRPRCTTDSQSISFKTAKVVYTCVYLDDSIIVWEDTLYLEEGIWKVAPQFTRVTVK